MTSHYALTTLLDSGAGTVLHTLVVPDDIDVRAPWLELTRAAVATHETFLRPGGPDPDPWVSEAHRIEQVLLELGWKPVDGSPSDLRCFPVVRVGQWRAQLLVHLDGARHAVVLNIDGDVIADHVLVDEPLEQGLTASGWRVDGPLPGWPDGVVAVAPVDWLGLVRESAGARNRAKKEAADAESRWRNLLREAVLDGQEVRSLASASGITPQRVYQIRDRRR